MKAYQVESDGGIDAIKAIELPEPKPGAGEVLVKIHANSLNYRDLGIIRGGYFRNDKCPVIPLSDGAGEVVEVGSESSRFRPGDRVAGCFFQDWVKGDINEAQMHTALGGGVDGVLAEYVVFKEQGLVPVPESLSLEEAATLPCAGVTAWQALVTLGKVKAGDTVLLLGTGGVSVFALQFAKASGARVVITSSSDEKLEKAKLMGADMTINYSEYPDWEKEVCRLTAGAGVDNVIEVGGPGTLEKSLKCARVSGRVSLIGVLDSPAATISPLLCLFNRITLQGIYVGSREMFEAMNNGIEVNAIKPVIDRVYEFSEALDAYHYLKEARHFGKVVIRH